MLNALRKSFLLRGIFALAVKGVAAVATFGMNIAVARALPIADAGLFLLAFTLVGVLVQLGALGTDYASLKFIGAASAKNEWPFVRAFAFWTRSRVACVAFLISFGLWEAADWISSAVFQKPQFGVILELAAPVLFISILARLLAHQLQAIRRPVQSTIVLSVVVPASVAIAATLADAADAQSAMLWQFIGASIALVLGYIWWVRAVPPSSWGTIDRHQIAASCRPIWITTAMSLTMQWSSQLVAGALVSPADVALLAVAQRTANLVSFLLIAVNLIIAPRFAALYADGNYAELRRMTLSVGRVLSLVGILLTAVIILFSEQIMGIFGGQFAAGSSMLIILSLGQLASVLCGSVGYLLNMTGHEGDMRNVALLVGPIAIALSIILTYSYGAIGAASATSFSIAAYNLSAVYVARQRLGFNMIAVWRRC